MPFTDPDMRRAYQRAYQREWARKNRERRLIYERNWLEANPGALAEKGLRYREKYPEKIRAQNTLRRAVYAGKIDKQPCEECGSVEVQAHHSDYTSPLDVRWLCRVHHMEEHRVYA